jgi:hypothetical protein
VVSSSKEKEKSPAAPGFSFGADDGVAATLRLRPIRDL